MYSKKLVFTLIGCLSLMYSAVFAGKDITKPDFTITLNDMDPVSHSSGGGVPGGRGAIMTILQSISEVLLFMIPLIAGVSLIIAGYFYIFSSGDTEKTNQGKTIIKWNVVATLVALCSWTLVQLVVSFFS